MSEFKISAREKLECMEFFSKGLTPNRNFVYSGFFHPNEEKLREGLSVILYKIMKKPSDFQAVKNEFDRLIEDSKYQPEGQAIYMKSEFLWHNPRKLFKESEKAKFERYGEDKRVDIRAGEVSTYGKFNKSPGLVFLRLITPPEEVEEGKLSKEKVWELRKTLMRAWKDLTKDKEVKTYISDVLSFSEALESGLAEGDFKSLPIFRLLSYLAPFDFTIFENAVLLSRSRLFRKEKKPEDLIKEIKEYNKSLWKDIEHLLDDSFGGSDWLNHLLNKIYDEEFLERLRKDWKEVLKELLKGKRKNETVGAFVQKGQQVEGKLSYGIFSIPEKEVQIYLFYEESLEGKVEDFKRGFEKAVKKFQPLTGSIKLTIKKEHKLSELIPHFKDLKGIDYSKGVLELKDSKILLFDLFYFIGRLKNFVKFSQSNKTPHAIVLLLDTDVREENGSYPFWDYFSLAYDFFSLPVQTLNRQTIDKFVDYGKNKTGEKQLQSIYKNLFISLMKDLKSLEFEFEGFKVPEKMKVYVILEKPSAGFCYERFNPNKQKVLRHYLYEAYLVHIEGNRVRVEIEDKFMVLAGGFDLERDRIIRWIENKLGDNNNIRFCFISATKKEDSFINDMISRSSQEQKIREKSLFVEYEELPIAYLSEKASDDCFVIYTSEFEKLKKELSINAQKHTISITLKPTDLKDRKSDRFLLNGERFYHSALQVFSTEGPGWERDEVYMEKKSLFLLTALAISQYESESFQTPYAKLELWQKRKNLYIKLRRDNGDYTMGLSGVLYELLYLASKMPSK